MLPRFEYYASADILEACRLKAAGAKPVAGGTETLENLSLSGGTGGLQRGAHLFLHIKGFGDELGRYFSSREAQSEEHG